MSEAPDPVSILLYITASALPSIFHMSSTDSNRAWATVSSPLSKGGKNFNLFVPNLKKSLHLLS